MTISKIATTRSDPTAYIRRDSGAYRALQRRRRQLAQHSATPRLLLLAAVVLTLAAVIAI